MPYTLTHNGTTQTLEAWGLDRPQLTLTNQAADVLVLREPGGAYDTAALFAYDDPVILRRDGVSVFSGRVQSVRRDAADADEARQYEIRGPWAQLEQIVYQQLWQTTNGLDSNLVQARRSRVILGQDVAGNKIATNAEMISAVDWAIANGADLAVGTIDAGVVIPYQELVDVTVAELIGTCLRWTPDAVVWFDYAVSPPALNIRRRRSLQSLSVAIDPQHSVGFGFVSREDLQVPAVALTYEKSHSYNGETWSTTEVDKYPAEATGYEPRSLVATISLEGSSSNVEEQLIETAAIAETSASWWKQQTRALADYPVGDLQITAAAVLESDGADGLQPSAYTKYLAEGSVQAWMTGVTAGEVVVKANIKYTGSNSALKPLDTIFSVALTGTDASRSRYTRTQSFTAAEETPVGLAQSLYEGLSFLHWQGDYTHVEDEVSGFAHPGNTLNFTGGQDSWATMDAMIQQVYMDLDQGETRLTFGPPEHLSPQDLVDRLRANRQARSTYQLLERTTAQKAAAGGLTTGAQKTPIRNTTTIPAAPGNGLRFLGASLSATTDAATLTAEIDGVYAAAALTPQPGDVIISEPYVFLVAPATLAYGTLPTTGFASIALSGGLRACQIGPNRFVL